MAPGATIPNTPGSRRSTEGLGDIGRGIQAKTLQITPFIVSRNRNGGFTLGYMHEKPDFRIAIVVGVTLAFMIAIGNLYWQVEHLRTENANLRQSIVSEVNKIAETATQAANSS